MIRYFFHFLIWAGFICTTLCIVLIIGEEFERRRWLEAPSTLHLYQTEETCYSDQGFALNCGHCGDCSNRHDIRIYNETSQTLTSFMTKCAIWGFFLGGASVTHSCFQQASNLTSKCVACWVLNAECNKQHCRHTCIKHRLVPLTLPSLGHWNDDAMLDPCTSCDERFCGPIFVKCAGANRRRAGVVSDIQRMEDKELCRRVDWDWVLGGGGGGDNEEFVAAQVSSSIAREEL